MNILGMGPMELLLIVVLALIVFGPARLPEIMAQVGKAIGDFRRATSDLSNEFNRTIQAELQETRAMVDEAKSTLSEARESLADVHSSVNSAVTGLPAPTRTVVPTESVPVANGVTTIVPHAESLTNGNVPGEASADLADASRWTMEAAAPTPTESEPGAIQSGSMEPPVMAPGTSEPGSMELGSVEPGPVEPGSIESGSIEPAPHVESPQVAEVPLSDAPHPSPAADKNHLFHDDLSPPY